MMTRKIFRRAVVAAKLADRYGGLYGNCAPVFAAARALSRSGFPFTRAAYCATFVADVHPGTPVRYSPRVPDDYRALAQERRVSSVSGYLL